jgi:hypothetical protein
VGTLGGDIPVEEEFMNRWFVIGAAVLALALCYGPLAARLDAG